MLLFVAGAVFGDVVETSLLLRGSIMSSTGVVQSSTGVILCSTDYFVVQSSTGVVLCSTE